MSHTSEGERKRREFAANVVNSIARCIAIDQVGVRYFNEAPRFSNCYAAVDNSEVQCGQRRAASGICDVQ